MEWHLWILPVSQLAWVSASISSLILEAWRCLANPAQSLQFTVMCSHHDFCCGEVEGKTQCALHTVLHPPQTPLSLLLVFPMITLSVANIEATVPKASN